MPLDDLNKHPFDLIRMPSEPTLDGLREWILRISEYLDVTPTELARAAGVAPSTLNRFLADKSGTRGLTAKTLRTLINAATELHSAKFGAAVHHQRGPRNDDFNNYSVVNVRVAASLFEDAFHKSHLWPVEQQFFTSVLIPNAVRTGAGAEESLKPGGLQGFVVADQHANRSFAKSTVLIGSPFSVGTDYLVAGRYYIVSRLDDQGRTEITVRLFMVSPSGDMWLVSQGTSKDSKPDVHLGRGQPDGMDANKNFLLGKYRQEKETAYLIEYTVICAQTPQIEAYEALIFPA